MTPHLKSPLQPHWKTCLLPLSAAMLLVTAPRASHAQNSASVSVNADSPLGAIPPAAFGINTAAWNSFMQNPQIPALYKQAGIGAVRYPGGSTSDVYHWKTNSSTPNSGQYINAQNTFDAFMQNVVQPSGAQAVITVNYGSNEAGTDGADPAEAAAWVDYANNVKGYGVKYWEVGNEIYGNKEYGGNWETDLHADQSPTAYGRNVALFSQAMKAKDPTIKVGAVLITPGGWPDGVAPDWNTNVLANCGNAIDFVIIHPYAQEPYQESDAGLLGVTSTYAAKVAKLRSLITQYCGVNALKVEICITETNSVSYNPGKQTVSVVNAMFLADAYTTWLENGVTNIDWWASHNGAVYGNASSSLYGSATYGDYGILSAGEGPEPAAMTPFPAYYGLQMVSYLGKVGDQMVSATSNQSLLAAHAVKQANGNLAVLLINKSPVAPCAASVSVAGYAPAGASTDYTYGASSGSVVSAAGNGGATFTRTVPPYTMMTVVLYPSGAPIPIPTPTPTPSTGPTPTPSPTPTPPPVAGSGYQINYSVTQQWYGGFNGNVVIQNTGMTAINGWTLTWTFPGNQAITGMWGGNYTQSEANVTVRNADYTAAIAPDSSVSFGFQANFTGVNPNPTNFVLKGAISSTTPTPTPPPQPTATPTPAPQTPTPMPTATPTPRPTVTPTPLPTPTPQPTPTPIPQTPTPTPTPAPVGAPGVSYSVVNQWPGGFQGSIVIQNNGPAINGWTLTWAFSGGQTIANLWNGNATQSGANVTVRNADYNVNIPAGGTVTLGFIGNFPGSTNPKPAAFYLNGVACAVQ